MARNTKMKTKSRSKSKSKTKKQSMRKKNKGGQSNSLENHNVLSSELTQICPICNKDMCDMKRIPCNHLVHLDCAIPMNSPDIKRCTICNQESRSWYDLEFINGKLFWKYSG